jgi:hypothetical protein
MSAIPFLSSVHPLHQMHSLSLISFSACSMPLIPTLLVQFLSNLGGLVTLQTNL